MSWFDATGIASLAKSALKEAQKTIDKALDIKEDDETDGSQACDKLKSSSSTSSISVKSAEQFSPESEQSSDTSLNMIKQSISNPILSTVTTATSASNLWVYSKHQMPFCFKYFEFIEFSIYAGIFYWVIF